MNYDRGQQTKKTTRTPRLSAAAALIFASVSMVTGLSAQIKLPTTPAAITVTAGNSAFLMGRAAGTQAYICLPTSTGVSWTVNSSRPEATLFVQGVQIITHFLSPDTNPNEFAPSPLPVGSPTWQSSVDSSVVWAKALTPSVAAGSDASCPNAGAIPCLLLQAIGSKGGPTSGKLMAQITFVQRLNTSGGSAPATGCSAAGDVGKVTLVPYTADYYFFRKNP